MQRVKPPISFDKATEPMHSRTSVQTTTPSCSAKERKHAAHKDILQRTSTSRWVQGVYRRTRALLHRPCGCHGAWSKRVGTDRYLSVACNSSSASSAPLRSRHTSSCISGGIHFPSPIIEANLTARLLCDLKTWQRCLSSRCWRMTSADSFLRSLRARCR